MPVKKKFKKYGWIPDLPDSRDYKYTPPAHIAGNVPSQMDLRNFCPGVYDQGNLGSCTANAIGGCCEVSQIKQNQPHWTPSRLFIYYNERAIENSIGEDAGAMIRDGIKTLVRWGFCPETMWPYVISQFKKKPTRQAYVAAQPHRISQYARVGQSINDIKACLAANDPIIFGFTVYESFESNAVAQTGMMPMPANNERALGGHAVLAVGYDDARQVVIVRNSWGDGWGDKGYFYMPYSFISNPNMADDFWTISYVP